MCCPAEFRQFVPFFTQNVAIMIRYFLTAVAALYVSLAAWCSLQPAHTSKSVGFSLQGGSGQSEFLVIYGGLELAMALVFLLPWLRPNFLESSLWACVIIHGCLVLFRSVSFALFREIQPMTYQLAAGEWVIFLLAAALLWGTKTTL